MGTWASPNTEKKARALKKLMENPIPVDMASSALYHLVGNDDLFDSFHEVSENVESMSYDIRPLVKEKLREWVSTMNKAQWYKPWSMEAVAIAAEIAELGDKAVNPDSLHAWFLDRLESLGHVESEDPVVAFCQSLPGGNDGRVLSGLLSYGRSANAATKGVENAESALVRAGAAAKMAADRPHLGPVGPDFEKALDEAETWIRRAREAMRMGAHPQIPKS